MLADEKSDEKQLLDKLFSIQRKNKEEAIVENIIMNILGKDDEAAEKPEGTTEV